MAQLGQNVRVKHADETRNKAGGVAYTITEPVQRLLHLCGTMVNEPTFYPDTGADKREDGLSSEAAALIQTCEEVLQTENPEDLLIIARWVREELHFRTSPIVMLAIAAQFTGGLPKPGKGTQPQKGLVTRYAPHILKRADEPANVYRTWRQLYGNVADVGGRMLRTGKTPNALKRAVSRAYKMFHETVLAKYAGHGGSPTVKDVIRACARDAISLPKVLYIVDRAQWLKGNPDETGVPRFDPAEATPFLYARHRLSQCTKFDEKAQRWAKKAQATWNDLTSQFGSDPEVWKFAAKQMPYMATLKNLRNLVQNKGLTKDVLDKIQDPKRVQKSKQFPYRFLSAARAFQPNLGGRTRHAAYSRNAAETDNSPAARKAVEALKVALNHSVANLEKLSGTTAIFVDNSWSMDSPVSEKSAISHVDAGNMLAAVLFAQSDDTVVCAFTDKPYGVACSKTDSVMTNMERISHAGGDGGSTNAYRCAPWLQQNGIKVDRIILVSDMQCWDSYGGNRSFRGSIETYRKYVGKDVWLHSINIGGQTVQSQMATGDKHVSLWSGFSGELINAIARAERGTVQAEERGEAVDVPGIAELREKYRVD